MDEDGQRAGVVRRRMSEASRKGARAWWLPQTPYRFDAGVAVVPVALAGRSRPLADLGDGYVAILVPGDRRVVRFLAPLPPVNVLADIANVSPFEPAADVVTLEGRLYDAPMPRRVRRRLARANGRRRAVGIGPRARVVAYHADDLCRQPWLISDGVVAAMEACSAR
jgi:hypothetical protein